MVFDTKLQLQSSPVNGFPLHFKLSFDSHLKKLHSGIGLYLGYSKTGFRNFRRVNLAYNVRLPFGEDHHLRIGVNLGAVQYAVFMDPSDIIYDRTGGNDILTNFLSDSYFIPEIKAGLWYNLKNFFIGVGVNNLTRPNLNKFNGLNRNIDHFLEPEVYVDAGYNLELGDISLIPMFQFRSHSTGITYLPTLLASWKNRITVGAGVSQNVVNFHLGGNILNFIRLTYGYGLWYKSLTPVSQGIHNIGVRVGF